MKYLRYYLLIVSLLVMAANTTAQTASEILDKYFTAFGGLQKNDSVRTEMAEGRRELDGEVETIRITRDGDELWREDVTMHSGTKRFTLLTKEGGWEYNEAAIKKTKKIKGLAIEKYQYAANIEPSLRNYKQPGFQATLLGKDSADGKQCFKLKIREGKRKEIFVWFDTATFLKIQSAVPSVAGFRKAFNTIKDVEVNVVTVFRDYKNVDSLLIPFTCLINAYDIHTNQPVRKVSTYFTKIEINKPIDPKFYKPETN